MSVTLKRYREIKAAVIAAGFESEIHWAENIKPVKKAWDFMWAAIWVIVSSGLNDDTAKSIMKDLQRNEASGRRRMPVIKILKHKGKAAAIEAFILGREKMFIQYRDAQKPIDYLNTLPYIGEVTKFHLAKNLGIQTPMPDNDLKRLAAEWDYEDVFVMVMDIAERSGESVATVDTVLRRACIQEIL